MKDRFKFHLLLFAIAFTSVSSADVLIDASLGNGAFVNEASDFNGSPSGWTAQRGVWVSSGNSDLESLPFGPDTEANSRFAQIHNDAGETLTSALTFTVQAGDTLSLSFDMRIGGGGSDTTLTVSLWDGRENSTFATLGTFSTADGDATSFVQQDLSYEATETNTNLRLRFSLSSAGGLGKDFHVDRVHLAGGVITPPQSIDYAYSHYVEATDTEEMRIEKAAKVLPKPKQVDWQRLEDTFFIHFGPNTFSGREWGTGFESPSVFNPSELDARQWIDVVKQAGGKLLVLVVKHHEGFCLYPSRYTTHDVASSPWLGGNGNLVREVADACAEAGIKLGIYLSPADLYQIESSFSYANGSGYYGNGSATQTSTIPTDPGAFGNDPTQTRELAEGAPTFTYDVDDYNRYFLNQLYELLTEYGEIAEVWFDGANPKPGTGQTYDYSAWFDMIYTLQPETCIFGGPDVRWVGNETGYARESEWSVVPKPYDTPVQTDLGSRAQITAGKTLEWFPAEADTKLLSGWFWNSSHAVKTVDQIIDIYNASVGRNANLLLNLSPDTRGLIPENQSTPLIEAYSVIRQTYARNLAVGGIIEADSTLDGQGTENILDGDLDTWWEPAAGTTTPSLTLSLPEAVTFDRIVLQEAIATRSQRIESFSVDAWLDGAWSEIGSATTVGHKRIVVLPETTTDQVRIRITQSRLEPSLASIGLHEGATLLASPSIGNRDAEGRVSISDANGNAIHYTTDNTPATEDSPLYTGPIDLPFGGTIRAISSDGVSTSFENSRLFPGVAPLGWQVYAVDSEEAPGEAAILAFDDDPNTLWHTAYSSGTSPHPHSLAIDMGESRWIRGFTYLPRNNGLNGVSLTYRFEVSEDGSTWNEVATGEFGNIRNSPVQQEVPFVSPVSARYIRFTSLSEVNGADFASAAEIGVLPAGMDGFLRESGFQVTDPSSDPDGDGRPLLLDYFFGLEPGERATAPAMIARMSGEGPMLEIMRKQSIPDLSTVIEMSQDLKTWEPMSESSLESTDLGNGMVRDRYQMPSTVPSPAFLRLRVN